MIDAPLATLPLRPPDGLRPASEGAPLAPQDAAPADGASAFGELLGRLVAGASAAGNEAELRGAEFAAGRSDDIHGTMIAVSRADIELRLLGSVRTKVVDAFYELWRMSI
ncbi:MAG: flagellar hook-basal body complex protein FliE [Polyangiaceae bacterium]|nr:flagellar hook-basal body complex protein FliE [Polyangiaceae bacterium]